MENSGKIIISSHPLLFNSIHLYIVFVPENVCVHQEQLKVIYQAQIESLEAQVISLRSVYTLAV